MDGDQTSIKEFLHKYCFFIPDYQRPYEWKIENFEEFLGDIDFYIEQKREGYIGTIILMIKEKSKGAESNAEVVDGQQRITSILIFLIVLIKKLKGMTDRNKNYRKITNYESLIVDPELEKQTLTPHESVKDDFKKLSDLDWDINDENEKKDRLKANNTVTKAFKAFEAELEGKKEDEIETYLNTVLSLNLMLLKVDNPEEAFHIFETTNARGSGLGVGDLLRNDIFGSVKDDQRKDVKDKWDDIGENVGTQMVNMLRQFYFTKDGYVNKKHLYRSIKKLQTDKLKLLEEINEYSEFFYTVKTGNENDFNQFIKKITVRDWDSNEGIKKSFISVAALRDFNTIQPFPVIYSFLKQIKNFTNNDEKIDPKNISLFFRNIENFHFINYKIGSNRAGKVETFYADYSKQFLKADSEAKFFEVLKQFYEKLNQMLDKYEIFESTFKETSYSPPTNKNTRHIRYIFSKYDSFYREKNKDSLSEIYNPDKASSANIEHWSPQEYKNDQSPYHEIWKEIGKKKRDNIGNLLILFNKKNSQLGNKSPEEKYAMLKDNKGLSHLIQNFFNEYEDRFNNWDLSCIEERSKKLSKFSYEKIWNIDQKIHKQ